MRRTIHDFFKTNIQPVRHYRTLIQNDKNRFQATNETYKYNFPKSSGFLLHFTHDQAVNETKTDYTKRCYNQVCDIIDRYGQNNFVFFGYSTVFQSQTEQFISIKSVQDLEQKFLNNHNILTSDLMVTAGHIAVYTKEGNYISHRPSFTKLEKTYVSQDDVVYKDVEESIKEKQQVSTYIVVLSRYCFPNITLDSAKHIIKKYGWAASDKSEGVIEQDNCATAIQKVFAKVKRREIMNPIQTLNFIVKIGMKSLDLTYSEENILLNSMLDSGLNRRLVEVARHEAEYKISSSPLMKY